MNTERRDRTNRGGGGCRTAERRRIAARVMWRGAVRRSGGRDQGSGPISRASLMCMRVTNGAKYQSVLDFWYRHVYLFQLLRNCVDLSTPYSHRWRLHRQVTTLTSRLNRSSRSLPVRPSSFSLPVRQEVLMVPKEDVRGSEAHEMDILPAQSETNGNDRGALVVSTDQDPDPEATREILSGISQDAGTISYFPLTVVCQVNNPYRHSS
jgi:hypothetical protein